MTKELRQELDKLLYENGLTLEELFNSLEQEKINYAVAEKNKWNEERKKNEEALLGKCFRDYVFGEAIFCKVLKIENSEYLTCLICPSIVDFYYSEDDETARLEQTIDLESISYDVLMEMTQISAEEFAAAIQEWGKKVSTFEITY